MQGDLFDALLQKAHDHDEREPSVFIKQNCCLL